MVVLVVGKVAWWLMSLLLLLWLRREVGWVSGVLVDKSGAMLVFLVLRMMLKRLVV